MTVLTAATPQLDLSANGMVEVRGSDGKMLGYFKLAKPSPDDYGPELSEEEKRRRLDRSTGVWYTAEQVSARLKELEAKCLG